MKSYKTELREKNYHLYKDISTIFKGEFSVWKKVGVNYILLIRNVVDASIPK